LAIFPSIEHYINKLLSDREQQISKPQILTQKCGCYSNCHLATNTASMSLYLF